MDFKFDFEDAEGLLQVFVSCMRLGHTNGQFNGAAGGQWRRRRGAVLGGVVW